MEINETDTPNLWELEKKRERWRAYQKRQIVWRASQTQGKQNGTS